MRWIKTPEVECDCIANSGETKVCEMHLRSGLGEFYKDRLQTKPPTKGKAIAYQMRRENGYKDKGNKVLDKKTR